MTTQIQLGDFEQFVRSEVMDLGGHVQSLRPITDILTIPSPEQIVHPLGTRHFFKGSATQQSCNNPLHTQSFKPKTDRNKIAQELSSCNTVLDSKRKKNKRCPIHALNLD